MPSILKKSGSWDKQREDGSKYYANKQATDPPFSPMKPKKVLDHDHNIADPDIDGFVQRNLLDEMKKQKEEMNKQSNPKSRVFSWSTKSILT